MKKLKIGYFADGPWSHEALTRILSDETLEIKFICARSENPDEILKSLAQKHGINFFTHPNVNSIEFLELVRPYKCDLFVSMSFNQIFEKKLIDLTPLKAINCHAGKLPFYRGRNVLNWVLINDESEFGITVHYMDEGIDTGGIILQKSFEIKDSDDYSTLLKTAYGECGSLLYESIKLLQSGTQHTQKQMEIHPIGSYCRVRIQGDENLDWNTTSRQVFNFVRAICDPGPQARTWLHGHEVKINKIELLINAPHYSGISGSVVGIEQGAFLVKTLDGLVRVTKWTGCALPKIGDRFK
jgi:methionyl-tRNA formyltransferase